MNPDARLWRRRSDPSASARSRGRRCAWSEPRFLPGNAGYDWKGSAGDTGKVSPSLGEGSYADLLVDGNTLPVFLGRSKRQILLFSLPLDLLGDLMTEEELGG